MSSRSTSIPSSLMLVWKGWRSSTVWQSMSGQRASPLTRGERESVPEPASAGLALVALVGARNGVTDPRLLDIDALAFDARAPDLAVVLLRNLDANIRSELIKDTL